MLPGILRYAGGLKLTVWVWTSRLRVARTILTADSEYAQKGCVGYIYSGVVGYLRAAILDATQFLQCSGASRLSSAFNIPKLIEIH